MGVLAKMKMKMFKNIFNKNNKHEEKDNFRNYLKKDNLLEELKTIHLTDRSILVVHINVGFGSMERVRAVVEDIRKSIEKLIDNKVLVLPYRAENAVGSDWKIKFQVIETYNKDYNATRIKETPAI